MFIARRLEILVNQIATLIDGLQRPGLSNTPDVLAQRERDINALFAITLDTASIAMRQALSCMDPTRTDIAALSESSLFAEAHRLGLTTSPSSWSHFRHHTQALSAQPTPPFDRETTIIFTNELWSLIEKLNQLDDPNMG